MRRWTTVCAGTLACGILAAATASAKVFRYEAKLATPVESAGTVRANIFNWQCDGNACRINGPWREPAVGHCRALARQVGEITAYGHDEAQLDAAQLEECNSVVPAAEKP